MSWTCLLKLGTIGERIAGKTITPVWVFIGAWILLTVTSSILPKKHRIYMAIIGALGFLIFPINSPRGGFSSLYSDLMNYQNMICGVCGLGLSLYAFRLEDLKNFRGKLGNRVNVLVATSGALFIFTTIETVRFFR